MIKRFLPIAGVCGLLSVALAGTAAAGGGGGYGGPGHFQFSDTTAYATFGDPSSGDYLTGIYVDRVVHVAEGEPAAVRGHECLGVSVGGEDLQRAPCVVAGHVAGGYRSARSRAIRRTPSSISSGCR